MSKELLRYIILRGLITSIVLNYDHCIVKSLHAIDFIKFNLINSIYLNVIKEDIFMKLVMIASSLRIGRRTVRCGDFSFQPCPV